MHDRIVDALSHARVVGVVGPRQSGKSTLARIIVEETPGARYVSLDNLSVRTEAERDPHGFVDDRPGLLAIDEVQRVPELLLAIKEAVDRDDRPGRFLITGSSQLSANRDVTETLAGRIVRFELWPLSQGELAGRRERFVDLAFRGELPADHRGVLTKRDYLRIAAAGGYPEALRLTGVPREDWFDSYVETVVEREAPGIAASPRTAELPTLLRLVAARHGGVLNVADLARDAGIPERTVHRYLETLEAVFLIRRAPAWAANLSRRETRAAKIYLTDAGLATHLRGMAEATLATPELALGADGPVIEGFVFTELLRQVSWSPGRPLLMHYRERNATEVDIICENRRGQVVAIEVKAASDVGGRDVRPLEVLRDRLGSRLATGVILYSGQETLRLGDGLRAMPISALWRA